VGGVELNELEYSTQSILLISGHEICKHLADFYPKIVKN
jgi:hypothetical protein